MEGEGAKSFSCQTQLQLRLSWGSDNEVIFQKIKTLWWVGVAIASVNG